MENEDKLSFLDSGNGAAPAPETTPSPAVTPDNPDTAGQPRDDAGRFAPKADAQPAPAADAPQQTPVPIPAQPAPVEAKQEAIPLATALDWRDRMTAAERRLKEVDARPQQPPPPVPSATADPEGYAAYLENIANSTRINTRFEMSEALARERHSDDVVQQAMDWAMEQAQQSPAFAAEYVQQRHPIDWAVKQQKRHSLLETIGDDPEAYIAAEIAKRLAANQTPTPEPQPAAPAAAPPPQVAQPAPAPAAPRSIANAPTAGSQHHVPSGPGHAFEATFPN